MKHEEMRMQYEAEAAQNPQAFVHWEYKANASIEWRPCVQTPEWAGHCQYRRKPKLHTITLTTDQLREVVLACEYPDWENEDFISAENILRRALGVPNETQR